MSNFYDASVGGGRMTIPMLGARCAWICSTISSAVASGSMARGSERRCSQAQPLPALVCSASASAIRAISESFRSIRSGVGSGFVVVVVASENDDDDVDAALSLNLSIKGFFGLPSAALSLLVSGALSGSCAQILSAKRATPSSIVTCNFRRLMYARRAFSSEGNASTARRFRSLVLLVLCGAEFEGSNVGSSLNNLRVVLIPRGGP